MPGLLAYKVWNPGTASVYTFNNTTTNNPAMTKVDATNLVLPAFTTGIVGKILVRLNSHIVSTATSADNFLKWCLVTAADAVVLPNESGTTEGRRVALHNEVSRRAKLEGQWTLAPSTSYTLYWGAGCGNQLGGAGGGLDFIMKAGGTFGPATMEIWDLDA